MYHHKERTEIPIDKPESNLDLYDYDDDDAYCPYAAAYESFVSAIDALPGSIMDAVLILDLYYVWFD
jgi:hypothetical protein